MKKEKQKRRKRRIGKKSKQSIDKNVSAWIENYYFKIKGFMTTICL